MSSALVASGTAGATKWELLDCQAASEKLVSDRLRCWWSSGELESGTTGPQLDDTELARASVDTLLTVAFLHFRCQPDVQAVTAFSRMERSGLPLHRP